MNLSFGIQKIQPLKVVQNKSPYIQENTIHTCHIGFQIDLSSTKIYLG